MPDIGPLSPASTYVNLLQIDGGLTSVLKDIEDGDGTTLPISISDNEVSILNGVKLTINDSYIALRYNNVDTYNICIKRPLSNTDKYNLILPETIASSTSQFLKVASISGENIQLEFDVPAGGGGGTSGLFIDDSLSSTDQTIKDSFGNTSSLYLGTDSVTIVGTCTVNGILDIYNAFNASSITIQNSNFTAGSYNIILPTAVPSPDQNVFLKLVSVTGGGTTINTQWETFDSGTVTLTNEANTFGQEQTFSSGIAITGGPMRLRAAKHTNTTVLSLPDPTIQSITPSSNCQIFLPDESSISDGHTHFVSHIGSSFNVTVANYLGTTIRVLSAGQRFGFTWDIGSSSWVVW